jgi:general stress protein YciG
MGKSDWTQDTTPDTTSNNGSRESAPARRRGFASMDNSLQRSISSKGGKAAHAKGKAHEFSADEAREAGRKGGHSVSKNREHMARIGREGGKARGRAQREKKAATAAE